MYHFRPESERLPTRKPEVLGKKDSFEEGFEKPVHIYVIAGSPD